MKDPKEIYTQIIQWLYLHDGNYPDKLKWRNDFVDELQAILGLDENQADE